MPRYIIGIDLGTTNSALAFIDLAANPKAGAVPIKTFPIPQLVAAGQVQEKNLLPSFLYIPGPNDLPAGAIALPWHKEATEVVGEFARNHGAKIPGRLVSSAKSWLCHAGVDRTQPLLPWTAPPDVPRLSPLEVSTRYLKYLVDAWNAHPGRKPEDRLEEQSIVLTVPASFDDVARNLTLEAAKSAGLKNVALLEEPQAAFYCWLGMNPTDVLADLKPGMRCLVVDVGGGTSDFSLIRAAEEKGEIAFVREAVGEHLLLGGDNMDLALAKYVEGRLGAGKLDAGQFAALVQACRSAKEQLLAPQPPASVPITVMGRGRSLLGNTLTAQLTPDEVRQVLFDGFFPSVPFDAEPVRANRGGLQEMGLPYVTDAAVTKHLAQFLRTQASVAATRPDAILFNGGVFQPQVLRDRLIDAMRPWYADSKWQPLILASASLDLAVAWGAAYAGWLRHVGGRRIGGGIPRSYYIAVETDSPSAAKRSVVCVVPRGLPEGRPLELKKPLLDLALGQPVLFPLYTSTARPDDQPGDVLAVDPDQLLELPPLHTILRGGKRSGSKRVPVTLASQCTEIGTLELFCVGQESGQRWRLEFNVRDVVREPGSRGKEPTAEETSKALFDIWPDAQVEAAASAIRGCFTATGSFNPSPTELPKALETALEAARGDWPSGLCRRLWDFLTEVAEERGRSAAHLNRWYHLAGWCLRPGFGDPLDRYRVEMLWKQVSAPFRAATSGPKLSDGGADYWIMWRRVAGGLSTAIQNTLFSRLRPVLIAGKGKGASRPSSNELAEMWRCAAALERLDLRTKEALGDELVSLFAKPPVPNYALWALTRLGTRRLLYGPLNSVLHPSVVQRWLDEIVSYEPGNDYDRTAWAFCLTQLVRLTGVRALDIDDSHRKTVRLALKDVPCPEEWKRSLEEVISESGDSGTLFGDTLPIGLRLRG